MFALTSLGGCLASTAAACACSCCTSVTKEALRQSARLGTCVLFTLSMVLAWVLRDFAKPVLQKLPWIIKYGGGTDLPDEWFGQQAVYRISLGNFLLFGTMALVMLGVRYRSDKRDRALHHGPVLLKACVWLTFNLLPFFFPVGLVNAYAWFARFASPLFLVVQMLIVVDMSQHWNDAWVESGEEDERYLYGLLGVTVAIYGAAAAIISLCYYWFAPGGHDCSFNITMITVALVLAALFSLVSLHPQVQRGSLFPSATVTLYVAYLAYSAMQSEPHDYECNRLGQRLNAASGTTLAAGMLLTLLSVVFSAFRAGSNTHTFSTQLVADAHQPLVDEEELTSAGLDGAAPSGQSMERRAASRPAVEYEPVSYSYSQFYTVFALASMYLAMLMTGWGSGVEEKDLMDVGWTSVWIKCVTIWVASALYAWTLVAPALFPDRDFS